MEKKIDTLFAAVAMIEILYEKGLVNEATLKAVKEKAEKEKSHISQVA